MRVIEFAEGKDNNNEHTLYKERRIKGLGLLQIGNKSKQIMSFTTPKENKECEVMQRCIHNFDYFQIKVNEVYTRNS